MDGCSKGEKNDVCGMQGHLCTPTQTNLSFKSASDWRKEEIQAA